MREIIFRGKTLDKGEWVYGNLITDDNDVYILTQENLSRGIDIGGWIDGVQSCEVIPETVGQYTGLKDKNGKRIFEGDILIYVVDGEYDVNEKYLVVFDDDEAAFRTKFYCEGKYMCYEDIIPCENFEIIGNIHDNPELLKGEDNG